MAAETQKRQNQQQAWQAQVQNGIVPESRTALLAVPGRTQQKPCLQANYGVEPGGRTRQIHIRYIYIYESRNAYMIPTAERQAELHPGGAVTVETAGSNGTSSSNLQKTETRQKHPAGNAGKRGAGRQVSRIPEQRRIPESTQKERRNGGSETGSRQVVQAERQAGRTAGIQNAENGGTQWQNGAGGSTQKRQKFQ